MPTRRLWPRAAVLSTVLVCTYLEVAVAQFCPATDLPKPLNGSAVGDSDDDRRAHLAGDGLGQWVAVWQSELDLGGATGSDWDIFVARSGDNGLTWTTPAVLNSTAGSDGGSTDERPRVATDGNGLWIAVWSSEDPLGGVGGGGVGDDFDIFMARSTNDGLTWSVTTALNTNAGTDTRDDITPDLVTDGTGQWLAVWSSRDSLGGTIGTDPDIVCSRSTDGGVTWSAPGPLNTNAASDSRLDELPQVATQANGTWIAVWQSADIFVPGIGSDLDIAFARSVDGGATWSAPQVLNSTATIDGMAKDFSPSIAGGGVDSWVTVWHSEFGLGGIGSDRDILYAVSSDDGGSWTAPASLKDNAAADGTAADETAVVSCAGDGSCVVLWSSADGLGNTIGSDFDILYAVSSDAGGSWSAAAALGDLAGGDGNSADFEPQVAGAGPNQWLALWTSENSLGGVIGNDLDLLFTRLALPNCDDGTVCTDDVCDRGSCVHTPLDCDDGNRCTDDTCDAAGGCQHAPNRDACDDGDLCTVNDTCSGGSCAPGAPLDCDDGDACTTDTCDPVSGCTHATADCDDGDDCTVDECDGISGCGHPPLDCADRNPCTVDGCDPLAGCTHDPELPGVACDADGDPCTVDVCDGAGQCAVGEALCAAGEFCVDGTCLPCGPGNGDCCAANGTAGCEMVPCCLDVCEVIPSCCSGVWDAACAELALASCTVCFACIAAGDCDDADACTLDDCVDHRCSNSAIDCGDGDACTADGCSPDTGCTHAALNCDDGDACTQDGCDSQSGCVHDPIDCADGNACTADSCDVLAGCLHAAVDCADGDACTADACDVLTGCTHQPADCDDGNACTADSCDVLAGCLHAAVDCADDDACTVDACDAVTGCTHDPADCDDGDSCTLDGCDPLTGCTHGAVNCDDGDACTADACDVLTGCTHQPADCDDGNACTADSCDVLAGCLHAAVDCADGDACTADACDGLTGCTHQPADCDDGDACTVDACDPVTGCTHDPADCDDGDSCTLDGCDPLTGCSHGAVNCDDGDACTADSCDAASGCVHEPADCDDGSLCTIDNCEPFAGCVHDVVNCNDGDPCNGSEFCDPIQGCGPGVLLDCNRNGNDDICDLAEGTSPDCNVNGIPDECDIASGRSLDLNKNAVPDECEVDCSADLNGNNIVDSADLAALLGEWGGDGIADLTGDNVVNGADLAVLLGQWGPCVAMEGACCSIPGMGCAQATADGCGLLGGIFLGTETICDNCPPPTCVAGAGDCCQANGTPGCDDVACCASVCSVDSFCCEVEWDFICAGGASGMCQLCLEPPPNDQCAASFPIFNGDTPFLTSGATTDGVPHPQCQFDGQTYNDVWYDYTASCTGTLVVSTCNLANYDTDLVVYNGCSCPLGQGDFLGCNDDSTSCDLFTSRLTVPVVAGQCYKVRVGGFSAGDFGGGTVTLSCQPGP